MRDINFLWQFQKDNNLTDSKLAQMLGFTRQMIYLMKHGKQEATAEFVSRILARIPDLHWQACAWLEQNGKSHD